MAVARMTADGDGEFAKFQHIDSWEMSILTAERTDSNEANYKRKQWPNIS